MMELELKLILTILIASGKLHKQSDISEVLKVLKDQRVFNLSKRGGRQCGGFKGIRM